MGAPVNAYPIGEPSRKGGDPRQIATLDDIPDIVCGCGYTGRGETLLGVNDEDTLWCPSCRSACAWYWTMSPNERKDLPNILRRETEQLKEMSRKGEARRAYRERAQRRKLRKRGLRKKKK